MSKRLSRAYLGVFLLLLVRGVASAQALVPSPNPVAFSLPAGSTIPGQAVVTLTNTGNTSVGIASITANVPWISVTPTPPLIVAALGTRDITVIANPTGLEAGNYTGTILIQPSNRPSSTITVNLQVFGGIITVSPSSISGLTLEPGSLTSRNISLSTNTGGTTLIQASGGSWLSVDRASTTQANTLIQVSISTNSLTPGNYSGSVRFSTTGGSPALPKVVTVDITVATPGNFTVTTNPSPVTYTDNTGSTTPKVAVATITSIGSATIYTVSKTANWVTLSKTSGSLAQNGSDTVNVTVNPTGLGAGTYNDVVTVTAYNQSKTFPVTLTISSTSFTVNPPSLTFTSPVNSPQPPAAQSLTLSNTGPAITYTATKTASWLFLSKSAGSIGANGSDSIAVSVSLAGLNVGTFNDTITITAPGRPTLTVPVTFTITGGIITASPGSISVSLVRGASTTRTLALNFSGSSATLLIEPSSTPEWLSVNKGSTVLGTAAPNDSIQVTINSANLTPGALNGTIRLSSNGPSPALPVVVSVSLTVTPDTTNLTVQPSQLSFSATANSSTATPGPQLIVVANSGPTVNYTVSKNAPWIVLSKNSGTLPADGGDSFTISADASTLNTSPAPGTVTVSASGRPDRTISVSLSVSPQPTSQTLNIVPSRLFFFAESGQTPVPQLVTVTASDSSSQQVSLSAASPSSWLQLSSNSVQAPAAFGVRGAATSVFLPSNGVIQFSPTSNSVASAALQVTLAAPGLPVYTIPRVADGNFFATTITIVNRDVVTATVSLTFFKENGSGGTGPWLPDMEGNTPLSNVTIPVGGSFTWQTRGVGTVGENGWALATCNQKISGFAIFRQTRPSTPSQEAAVPINSGWQQRFLVPFDNIGNITAVALSNVSATESASITAIFKDEQGQPIPGTFARTLPPQGHVAFGLPSELPALDRRRGTAEFFTTSGRLSAVGLRFSTVSPAFTSFEPQSLNIPVTGALTIPQVADGMGDGFAFTTTITIVNNDIVSARVTLRFYQRNPGLTTTRTWLPTMQDGAPIENVEIKPGASFTWRTRGIDPFAQGWAEVITSERVSGFAIFQQLVPGRTDQEAAVPVNAGAQQRFLLPFDNTGQFATTMALANFSSTETALINVVFRDAQNAVITSSQISLPARAHDAFSLFERFPALRGQRGVAEFTALSGQVSPLGLRFSDIAFTSFRTQVF